MEVKWMSKWFRNHYADSLKIQIRNVEKKIQTWIFHVFHEFRIKTRLPVTLLKVFLTFFWSVKIRNFKIQIKDKFNLAEFFFCLRIFAFLKSQLEEVLKNKQKTPKFHAIYSTIIWYFFKTITLLISFSSGVSQQAKSDLRHGVERERKKQMEISWKKGLHSTGGEEAKVPE